VEGLVPIDTLPGDSYRFHENARRIIGERSRREFSIGDRVQVILDRVDALQRKLTFAIVEPEVKKRGKRR
jgi:ribonuclease R